MKSRVSRRNSVVLVRMAAAVAVALPLLLLSEGCFADGSITVMHGAVVHESVTSDGRFTFKLDGDMDFNEAEDDIAQLSGKAIFRETRDGHTREMRFEPGANNSIARTYTLDGHEHAIDADAKRWLANAITDTIRETGVNADKRCKRLFKNGGADAVLAEIEKIHSDYARRLYIITLAGLTPLDTKPLARLLADVKGMTSDFERRTAYIEIINKQSLNATNMSTLLAGVANLQSDFEKRATLVELVPKLIVDDSVYQGLVTAVKSIQSDFEHRTVIVTMANHRNPVIDTDWALALIGGINSDFERRTVLVAIAGNMQTPSTAQVLAYAQATKRIGSDFERRTALLALLDKAALDKTGYKAMLDAVDGMGSSFEIRAVLVEMARRMPMDGDLIARYRQIAQRLGQFERNQAEQALAHAG